LITNTTRQLDVDRVHISGLAESVREPREEYGEATKSDLGATLIRVRVIAQEARTVVVDVVEVLYAHHDWPATLAVVEPVVHIGVESVGVPVRVDQVETRGSHRYLRKSALL
jgi:hypothetical protein